ncbi:MAG: hypothetical protein SGARI_001388, partial [Bacillariaceae sp.]
MEELDDIPPKLTRLGGVTTEAGAATLVVGEAVALFPFLASGVVFALVLTLFALKER